MKSKRDKRIRIASKMIRKLAKKEASPLEIAEAIEVALGNEIEGLRHLVTATIRQITP